MPQIPEVPRICEEDCFEKSHHTHRDKALHEMLNPPGIIYLLAYVVHFHRFPVTLSSQRLYRIDIDIDDRIRNEAEHEHEKCHNQDCQEHSSHTAQEDVVNEQTFCVVLESAQVTLEVGILLR